MLGKSVKKNERPMSWQKNSKCHGANNKQTASGSEKTAKKPVFKSIPNQYEESSLEKAELKSEIKISADTPPRWLMAHPFNIVEVSCHNFCG